MLFASPRFHAFLAVGFAICICLYPALAAYPQAPAIIPAPGAQQPAKTPTRGANPSVNETWKSTQIEPLVERLEAESREIYRERAKLAALVAPKPGSSIADVGAGSGFMVEEFAKLVGPTGKVYAVDINAKMMERVAARAKSLGLANIETIVTREDSVDLPPASVDMVFICDTYHHFEFPDKSLRSIYDSLRPGGQLIIVDFHRVPDKTDPAMLEHVRAGKDEFTREITAAGFSLVTDHAAAFLTDNYVLRFAKVSPGEAFAGTSGVGYAACVSCSNPKLTREAATSKDFREALVHLQVLVSAQGRVEAIKVTKDPGFGLAEAAAASVRDWRFSPAKGPDGKPVASWNALEVVFRKAP